MRALHAVEKRRGGQGESEKSQAACFQQACGEAKGALQTRLQDTLLFPRWPANSFAAAGSSRLPQSVPFNRPAIVRCAYII